ncbi:MAG: hypothetical protein HY729_05140 [Candidatus Rokubacteria bacterium]|nr:hypothetical protein [Candidatus Rokubacteria bacterium]
MAEVSWHVSRIEGSDMDDPDRQFRRVTVRAIKREPEWDEAAQTEAVTGHEFEVLVSARLRTIAEIETAAFSAVRSVLAALIRTIPESPDGTDHA